MKLEKDKLFWSITEQAFVGNEIEFIQYCAGVLAMPAKKRAVHNASVYALARIIRHGSGELPELWCLCDLCRKYEGEVNRLKRLGKVKLG